jgi:hypothetical protein
MSGYFNCELADGVGAIRAWNMEPDSEARAWARAHSRRKGVNDDEGGLWTVKKTE